MKHKIVVVGGSLREQIVADMLRENGFSVHTFATERPFHKDASSINDCMKGASVLILPVRSNSEDLMIEGTSEQCPVVISKELLMFMKKGAMVYCGAASNSLRELCKETDLPLCEIMTCDEVAVPNAALTAEGTLSYIMCDSKKSLKETNISVFGYGRVGRACAALFASVGCKVVVFCRKEEDIRHGRERGIDMRYYSGCSSVLPKADYLVNTVPSLVVDEQIISLMNKKGVILDLASMPGGVDKVAADAYGVSFVMLPGIPGKYAPISAGRILGSYYLKELKSFAGGDR